MLDITPICKRFNKLPGHFRDNYKDKSLCKTVTHDRVRHTYIHESLIPEFLLWLSNGAKGHKPLRTMLAVDGIEKTLEFVKRFKMQSENSH